MLLRGGDRRGLPSGAGVWGAAEGIHFTDYGEATDRAHQEAGGAEFIGGRAMGANVVDNRG